MVCCGFVRHRQYGSRQSTRGLCVRGRGNSAAVIAHPFWPPGRPSRAAREIEVKLRRADKHLEDLHSIITAWAADGPYEAEHRVEGKRGEHVYRLRFTEEPDEMAAAVVGDFLNNVRSALDYLMAGLVPSARRGRVYFPIVEANPFLRDPHNPRKYLERRPEARRRWKTYTQGVEPDALCLIKEFQPFNMGRPPGKVSMLTVLASLSNADKHRQLSAVPVGLEGAQLYVNGIASDAISAFSARVVKAGDELYRGNAPAQVEIEGTPIVLIRVGRAKGAVEIRAEGLSDMRLYVRGIIVGSLAPYLRR